MKKLLLFFVVISIILTNTTMICGAAESVDYVIIDEKFDENKAFSDKWSFKTAPEYEIDANGGKALAVAPTASGGYNTSYKFQESVSSGLIKISFSIRPSAAFRQVFYVFDSENKQYPLLSLIPPSSAVVAYAGAGYKDCIITSDMVYGEWYDVVCYIDMNEHKSRTFLTGRNGDMWSSQERELSIRTGVDLKDISRFELQGWFEKQQKNPMKLLIDNIRIEKTPVSFFISTANAGNVFGADEAPEVLVDINNSNDKEENVTVEWKVDSDVFGFVDSGTESVSMQANESSSIVIKPKIQKYGLYYITVKVGNEDHALKQERNLRFAKILSSEEGEANEKFLLCTQMFKFGPPVENVSLIKKCGASGWRVDFTWNAVEQNKGTLEFRWKNFYETMDASKTMHNNTVILFSGNIHHVKRYGENGAELPANYLYPPVTQSELKAFADYCKFVASDLKDTVNTFEVWNEWDLPYSNPERLGAKEYIAVLKTAYEAVKSVNPNAIIIGLGGSGTGTDGSFDKEFISLNGEQYCDALSFHTYDYHRGKRFPNSNVINRVRDRLDLYRNAGIDKPIYTTEIGWPTAIKYSDPTQPVWSERDQAMNMVKYVAVSIAENLNDKIYWYSFQENSTSRLERENTFGMVNSADNPDGTLVPKPAYVACAAMNKFMTGNVKYVSCVKNEEWLTSAFRFKRPAGDDLAIVWSDEELKDYALDLGCNSVDVYDLYGNKIETMFSENGVYNFGLSKQLIYIIGRFTKFEEAEPTIHHSDSSIVGVKSDILSIEIDADGLGDAVVKAEGKTGEVEPVNETVTSEDGRARIALKTSDDIGGTSTAICKMYNGSKCVYISDDVVSAREPVDVTVASFQSSQKIDTHWELKIGIKNLANERAISGVCRITEPLYIAENCKETSFKNLEPKKIRYIYMNLPEMVKKRTVTIKGEIELDDGHISGFEEHLDFSAAQYTKTPPKIDGIIEKDEWLSGIVTADKIENIGAASGDASRWNGVDDLSIEAAKFLWDEENFYLMAVVKDDTFVMGEDPAVLWKYDSIQFAIEDGYNNMPGMPTYPFTEIGVARLKGGPAVYRYSANYDQPVGVVDNCEAAVERRDNKTIYELKIPWSELFNDGYKIDPSWIYGFSMLANDNDDTDRWGWIQYNEGVGTKKDVTMFGKLKLNK